MTTPPFVSISDDGMAFLAQHPDAHQPGKHDYDKKPVRVAVHRDLSLELHGERFSVSTKLTADDALGIISVLTYVLREQLVPLRKTQFVEVTR